MLFNAIWHVWVLSRYCTLVWSKKKSYRNKFEEASAWYAWNRYITTPAVHLISFLISINKLCRLYNYIQLKHRLQMFLIQLNTMKLPYHSKKYSLKTVKIIINSSIHTRIDNYNTTKTVSSSRLHLCQKSKIGKNRHCFVTWNLNETMVW